MTYEVYKSLMGDFKNMKKLSDFARENPSQYARYRQRFEDEETRRLRLKNRELTNRR